MSANQGSASLHILSKVDSLFFIFFLIFVFDSTQKKKFHSSLNVVSDSDSQGCVVRSNRAGCLVVIALNL